MAAAPSYPDSSLSWVLQDEKVGGGDKRYRLAQQRMPVPELLEGQVLVRISYAALNRRDHWIRLGLYPGIAFPAVLGADCCGQVAAVHESSSHRRLLGKRVLLDSSIMWGDHEKAPTPMFHLLGMVPAGGTLGEYVVVQAEQVYEVPDHLTCPQAAALPLAGLTGYRATVTKAEAAPGKRFLVTGIGGGVALFCLQFAVAMGVEVWVTSSSTDKIKRAVQLGAAGGVSYRDKDWKAQLRRAVPDGFDAVVDGAGGDSMNVYVSVLKMGGIISMYGATAGRPKAFNVTRLFLNNQELRGTSMGSPREFQAMLRLVTKARISPVVSQVFGFDAALQAFDCMRDSRQFGKLVVQVADTRVTKCVCPACSSSGQRGAVGRATTPLRAKL